MSIWTWNDDVTEQNSIMGSVRRYTANSVEGFKAIVTAEEGPNCAAFIFPEGESVAITLSPNMTEDKVRTWVEGWIFADYHRETMQPYNERVVEARTEYESAVNHRDSMLRKLQKISLRRAKFA